VNYPWYSTSLEIPRKGSRLVVLCGLRFPQLPTPQLTNSLLHCYAIGTTQGLMLKLNGWFIISAHAGRPARLGGRSRTPCR